MSGFAQFGGIDLGRGVSARVDMGVRGAWCAAGASSMGAKSTCLPFSVYGFAEGTKKYRLVLGGILVYFCAGLLLRLPRWLLFRRRLFGREFGCFWAVSFEEMCLCSSDVSDASGAF